ncbi:Ribonuclease h2, subunit c, partial [Globisporangium splendens]
MASGRTGATRVALTRCPLPPPEESVHCLPCRIHFDGKAPVKNYFRPEALTAADHVQDVTKLAANPQRAWRAEFRGIQLQGEKLTLRPLGYQGQRYEGAGGCHGFVGGLVLEDSGMTHPDDEGKMWEVDHHFDELTYWDVPNNNTDENAHLPTTLQQWIQVAHALHDDDDE